MKDPLTAISLSATGGTVVAIGFLAFMAVTPPTELEGHAQVPRHDPVSLNTGDERVQPVQQ